MGLFKGWAKFRDNLEAAAVVAGNYYLPGSSLVTSHLVTEGAQRKLNSDLGRAANLASGAYGGYSGNMSNYSSLGDMFSAAPGEGVNSVNGADIGGPGSSPANTGDMSSMTSAPTSSASATATPFTPSTVTQGSNIAPTPTYGTEGGAGNYGYDMGTGNAATGPVPDPYANESLAETNRLASQNVNATGTPTATPTFLESLTSGGFGDAAKTAGKTMMDNKLATAMVGSSLYDMYAKRQMARKQDDLYNRNRADIMGMYAPGSPEEIAMQREMARKDAASGRNSQYGIRSADYAGNVAKFKSNALSNLGSSQNALAAAQMGNQYGGLNSMFNNLAMYSLMNKKTA